MTEFNHRNMPHLWWGYLYEITDLGNGQTYIGKHRLKSVDEPFRRYLGSGSKLRSAMKSKGRDEFAKRIICFVPDENEADRLEIELIRKGKDQGKCEYNILTWDSPRVSCAECSEAWGNYTLIQKHLRDEHGITGYFPCEVCEEILATEAGLRSHHRAKHTDPEECPLCGALIRLMGGMAIHMRTDHTPKYVCSKCDKNFTYEARFDEHVSSCLVTKCLDCTNTVSSPAKRCHGCNSRFVGSQSSKSGKTPYEIFVLFEELGRNFSRTGRELGVSGNAVRKRIKNFI